MAAAETKDNFIAGDGSSKGWLSTEAEDSAGPCSSSSSSDSSHTLFGVAAQQLHIGSTPRVSVSGRSIEHGCSNDLSTTVPPTSNETASSHAPQPAVLSLSAAKALNTAAAVIYPHPQQCPQPAMRQPAVMHHEQHSTFQRPQQCTWLQQ
jgi:hypothetical protein